MIKNLLMATVTAISATLTASAAPDIPSERVQKLMSLERPLVIAHRGYKMAAPENTIPSFKAGILAHADLVELDYYHSSDGIPFVFHDSTLDRTSNAATLFNAKKIPTTSKTLAELQKLDAGSWFSPIYANTPVPTLDEALDVIQSGSVTLIERKQGDAKTLIDLLRKKEILHDVVIQAFDWNFIADCREIAPNAVLGALGPPSSVDGRRLSNEERFLNNAFLDQVQASGAQVVGWNRQVTREAVEEAHKRGLKVWIYTINELDLALDLLEIGVDGLITDNPALGWKAVAVSK